MLRQRHSQQAVTVRPVMVDVYAEPSDTEGASFTHKWKFDDDPRDPLKSERIDLPEGAIAYKLHFHLHDKSGRNLKFVDPTSEAMWVSSGPIGGPSPPCPTAAGNGGQISYDDPWTPRHLKVEDGNFDEPCLLTYTLRFDGDPFTGVNGKQCPPYEYDPELKNGGGNFTVNR